MRYFIALSLALVSLSSAMAADSFKLIHVEQLDQMLKATDAKVQVLDANSADTRNLAGVIPGAKLLSSSSKFDVSAELPADKNTTLVFYCANTKCTASHDAAKRATAAGYKNVDVMVDGIQGWVKAGKPVEKPAAKT